MNTLLQKLLEVRERDHDICDNLRAVKGEKYAETISAFANLVSLTELLGKATPGLREPIRGITCDTCQAAAKLLDVSFQAFMDDVMMIAQSRVAGATAVMGVKKAQGGDRG